MGMNRQYLMLAVLAVVAVWALWLSLGGDGPLVSGPGRSAQARSGLGELPPVIRLADLERQEETFNPSGGRNLFAYAEAKRVAATRPPAGKRNPGNKSKPGDKPAAPKKVVAPPPPVPTAPPAPTPPTVNFKFVGYLGPQSGLIGVFSVSTPDGEEVVLAGEGDILAESFRVHRIGYEEVEIGYTEEPFLNERKVLPMGGQS